MLAIAALTLMTLDHRYDRLDGPRAALATLAYPLQFMVNLPVEVSHWAADRLASGRDLREERDQLLTEQLILKMQLQRLSTLELENQRLRELLDSAHQVSTRVLIAELLAVDTDPYHQQIVINKGSQDGVYAGQPLLDAEGVMGQVSHVSPLSATATLITDAAHALPVQINRNGLRSVAIGSGRVLELKLPHVPNNADIRPGDLLVTSGLGGRFPAGYPVAEVTRVQRDPGQPFAQVTATPRARLDRSREVLLVWGPDAPAPSPSGSAELAGVAPQEARPAQP